MHIPPIENSGNGKNKLYIGQKMSLCSGFYVKTVFTLRWLCCILFKAENGQKWLKIAGCFPNAQHRSAPLELIYR